ncbi:MAG: alpha/beta hydrolase [Clostridia bacterium]|nr:alpha/beta hydrolase [Clostridia bacterium]
MEEEKFKCYDDIVLHAYIFEPSTKPKGVVQFVHGMQEYCKPYFQFAEFLNKKGFVVYMVDQRAHGKTCKKISEIGKADGDIFGKSVYDQLCISSMLKSKYNLPIYMIGHSYGSFIAQAYMPKNKNISKFVLLGSAYMKQPKVWYGEKLVKFASKFKNKEKCARYIERKVFGKYNKNYTKNSWITSDEEQENFLRSDRLCRIPFSTAFYESLFTNLYSLYKDIGKIDKAIPIAIFSGSDDPIGSFGKSVFKLYSVYKNAGLNAKMTIYSEARHSLLHEKNRVEVYNDIFNFLAKK